mmetsp:Transcript_43402/g.100026  ORF Transcript_43402/g.100026 Transcript_43402/m.100026 type:complete len:669 (+) Transcript_43402:23-2029(+)
MSLPAYRKGEVCCMQSTLLHRRQRSLVHTPPAAHDVRANAHPTLRRVSSSVKVEQATTALRGALAVVATGCAASRVGTRRQALVSTHVPAVQTATMWPEPQGQLRGKVYLWQQPCELPGPLSGWLAPLLPQHSVVITKCDGGYAAFDFAPVEKYDLVNLLWLFAGGSVEGRCRARHLSSLPDGVLPFGDVSEGADVNSVTAGVNRTFPPHLSLHSHDCHTYSQRVMQEILADPEKPVDTRLFSTVHWEGLEEGNGVAYKEPSVFNAAVLIAGVTVGAGALALPAVAQPAGFVPSTAALFCAWLYMATTGLLTAEVALSTMASSGETSISMQSMAAKTVGRNGASLVSVTFAFLHLALMVAYLSRGGELLADIFPMLLTANVPGPLAFATVFGGFAFLAKGTDLLDGVNNFFAFMVVAAFLSLVAFTAPSCTPSQLFTTSDWSQAAATLPIVILSLAYHNIVPTVCSQLEGDRGKISQAIMFGSFMPFLMFVMWNAVVLSSLPPGTPMTVDPLDFLRTAGGPIVNGSVLLFSLSAIVTSFFGLVLSLMDFFQDCFNSIGVKDNGGSSPEARNFALTIGVPLLIACWDPTLFFKALDSAGAFGDTTLFGLLPALMALQVRASEPRVLAREPRLMGGYPRGPMVAGGEPVLLMVAVVAIVVVGNKAMCMMT